MTNPDKPDFSYKLDKTANVDFSSISDPIAKLTEKMKGMQSKDPKEIKEAKEAKLSRLRNSESSKDESKESETKSEPEDLNILPLPTRQDILADTWIRWTWVTPVAFIHVVLFSHKNGDSAHAGTFEINVSHNIDDGSEGITSEQAKAFGQALVSASNWHNVWKQHAGYFLEKEFLGE